MTQLNRDLFSMSAFKVTMMPMTVLRPTHLATMHNIIAGLHFALAIFFHYVHEQIAKTKIIEYYYFPNNNNRWLMQTENVIFQCLT